MLYMYNFRLYWSLKILIAFDWDTQKWRLKLEYLISVFPNNYLRSPCEISFKRDFGLSYKNLLVPPNYRGNKVHNYSQVCWICVLYILAYKRLVDVKARPVSLKFDPENSVRKHSNKYCKIYNIIRNLQKYLLHLKSNKCCFHYSKCNCYKSVFRFDLFILWVKFPCGNKFGCNTSFGSNNL